MSPSHQSLTTPSSPQQPDQPLLQPDIPAAKDPRTALAAALQADHPSIPVGFLYDDVGSRLFTAITALDEYYPTRTEAAILTANLPAILAARPPVSATMIDLGAGNCEKAANLFAAVQPARYVAVDVSVDFLSAALASLRTRFPQIEIQGVGLDFSEHLELPESVPLERRLFFYPGSSIGNFAPAQAESFLRRVREHMAADGTLWIGVDLHKDSKILERAYDDELGVTAAFIRNVLRNINRFAGTDFKLGDWRYTGTYDEIERRVEMHLVAIHDLIVRWPGGERRFAEGDRIHAENSYKHTIDSFSELLERAGLRRVGCWTDEREWFGFFVAAPA